MTRIAAGPRRDTPARSARVLGLAVAVMTPLAVGWLGYQHWRLLSRAEPVWPGSPVGAVDLEVFHDSVRNWFAGRPVYGSHGRAFYPPATYAMLWPLLGSLDFAAARALWAATGLACLAATARMLVAASGAASGVERAFVALLLLASYPAGATIGNGQLAVHVLAALLGGWLVLARQPASWRRDLSGSALILLSLAKPSLSAPFMWLVLFAPGGWRPFAVVVFGYGTLTALAAGFQGASMASLLREWVALASREATQGGAADLSHWLAALGWERWMWPLSLLVLAAVGVWVHRHRRCEAWLQLGVVAIAARLWMHHRWYDDLLLVLPMVTLFRLAKQAGPATAWPPMACLSLNAALMLAPGGLHVLPATWATVFVGGQTLVWLGSLGYLLAVAARDARGLPTAAADQGIMGPSARTASGELCEEPTIE